MLPVDFLGAVPQQAWVAARELPGLSGLGARRRPLYSCSCAASPPTPLSSPQPGTQLFQKAQPPFLCFTFNFVPKNEGGGWGVSFSMPYFAKKKKSLLPPDQALGPQDIEALSFTSTNNPTCTQSARVSNIRPSGPQALEMRPCRIYSAGA